MPFDTMAARPVSGGAAQEMTYAWNGRLEMLTCTRGNPPRLVSSLTQDRYLFLLYQPREGQGAPVLEGITFLRFRWILAWTHIGDHLFSDGSLDARYILEFGDQLRRRHKVYGNPKDLVRARKFLGQGGVIFPYKVWKQALAPYRPD